MGAQRGAQEEGRHIDILWPGKKNPVIELLCSRRLWRLQTTAEMVLSPPGLVQCLTEHGIPHGEVLFSYLQWVWKSVGMGSIAWKESDSNLKGSPKWV